MENVLNPKKDERSHESCNNPLITTLKRLPIIMNHYMNTMY